MTSPRRWTAVLPIGKHEISHVRVRVEVSTLAVASLGQAVGVALGDHGVGVVHEPVDCGGGDGGGQDLVEAAGVDVARDRDRPASVGGIDDPEQRLGGLRGHGERPGPRPARHPLQRLPAGPVNAAESPPRSAERLHGSRRSHHLAAAVNRVD